MEMNQLPEGKLGVLEGNRPKLPFPTAINRGRIV
jgi:hypothetical protein